MKLKKIWITIYDNGFAVTVITTLTNVDGDEVKGSEKEGQFVFKSKEELMTYLDGLV